jgi:hypothetical protein
MCNHIVEDGFAVGKRRGDVRRRPATPATVNPYQPPCQLATMVNSIVTFTKPTASIKLIKVCKGIRNLISHISKTALLGIEHLILTTWYIEWVLEEEIAKLCDDID